MIMERKVGEVFEDLKGNKVKVVRSPFPGTCTACLYDNHSCCMTKSSRIISGYCASMFRSDGKDVIFKEVTE